MQILRRSDIYFMAFYLDVHHQSGLTLPLAIVAICYYKCRVATNINHWLKVQSPKVVQNYICVTVYFDQLLGFQVLLLLFLHTLSYNVPYFTLWMPDFFITIWVSNSLDPDQALHVGSDLGPNCLQSLSADTKSCP